MSWFPLRDHATAETSQRETEQVAGKPWRRREQRALLLSSDGRRPAALARSSAPVGSVGARSPSAPARSSSVRPHAIRHAAAATLDAAPPRDGMCWPHASMDGPGSWRPCTRLMANQPIRMLHACIDTCTYISKLISDYKLIN